MTAFRNLYSAADLAERQAIASRVLVGVVKEAFTPAWRRSVRTATHREDLCASLEVHAPGLGLRVLALIDADDGNAAVEMVSEALHALHALDADLFRDCPSPDKNFEIVGGTR